MMNISMKQLFVTLLVTGGLLVTGCADTGQEGAGMEADTTDVTAGDTDLDADAMVAEAVLQPTEGNTATGTVTFTQVDDGVQIMAAVTNAEPEGQHGFHVHENGDCSAPDASSAGGHFAPEGSPHGAPTDPADQRHVGDLGNLEVGADGTGSYERVDEQISLNGPNSIVGKAVVLHQGEDDLESQPSGDAGSRIACGVIEMAEGAMNAVDTPDTGM